MVNRAVYDFLRKKSESKFGRITILTGARQTGKTTLVKEVFPDFDYISLDDPVTRPDFAALSATQWYEQYPIVILDEIQKLPQLVESVKAVYDQFPDARFVLLGSSQILLLKQVKESLAGRVALIELYPLTLPERLTSSWSDEIKPSKLIQFLNDPVNTACFKGIPQADQRYAQAEAEFQKYLNYGSMPAIVDDSLEHAEKRDWLYDYISTYLQRDIRDLANLRELEPFVRAQKTLASLTSQLLNISTLAKQAGITNMTAKRFINYLELSYQMILLPPWFRNQNKRLSKSPKVHFLDPGIQRVLLSRSGELTGGEFESAVVSEFFKQIKNSRLLIECYHLRTLDGREVDLLLELEEGYIAVEIKKCQHISSSDAKHLRKLADILDKPLLHTLLVSNDPRIQTWDDGAITALPAAWLLT
ncbi:MAG TPA: ATP-binding protein [Gammaproteobacteria bacterium]|nr:ATP-binding protein [Gammaproteobacteria bacterium]